MSDPWRDKKQAGSERGDHVFQEPERVRDAVFVDYGAAEPRVRVRQEAGRLFLHCQHLPSEMRLEMPQSAHHSHLCLLQALTGTRRVAAGSSTSGSVLENNYNNNDDNKKREITVKRVVAVYLSFLV